MNKDLLTIGATARLIGVSVDTLRRWDQKGQLKSFRVSLKSHRYYRKTDLESFLKNLEELGKAWASSQKEATPEEYYYCASRDVFQARLEKFQSNLMKEERFQEIFSLITAICGEIGNNAFDHNLGNWPDVAGIFFAYDLNKRVVVIADRGQGIWKTLARVKPELADHQEALQTGFTEILSGRAPEERGNGLKFVRQVVTSSPLELFFQTGDASLNLSEKNHKLRIDIAADYLRGCFASINF